MLTWLTADVFNTNWINKLQETTLPSHLWKKSEPWVPFMRSLCEALRTNHIKTAKKHPSPSCSLGTDMKVITKIHKITYGASKGEWPQIFEELSQAENYLAKSRKKMSKFLRVQMFHSNISAPSSVTSELSPYTSCPDHYQVHSTCDR